MLIHSLTSSPLSTSSQSPRFSGSLTYNESGLRAGIRQAYGPAGDALADALITGLKGITIKEKGEYPKFQVGIYGTKLVINGEYTPSDARIKISPSQAEYGTIAGETIPAFLVRGIPFDYRARRK